MNIRGSGILLHITSLPSPYGIGDLGPGAYRFVDFLRATGQCYWQILPLNATRTDYGNSPYSSYSAFAGNPLLVSPDLLVEEGFLLKEEIKLHPPFPEDHVDYRAVTEYKYSYLNRAYERYRSELARDGDFERFQKESACWLDDYAMFITLKKHFKGVDWSEWPVDIRDRHTDALKRYGEELSDVILREKFFQYVFFKQWYSFKNFLKSNNIQIIGDIPIYVNYESTDVWANPGIFKINGEKRPTVVAGVPPDYFSATGQLWGNPVYNWDVLKSTRYSWWIKRMEHNLKLFDIVRLDHFRGFVAYWEVDAGAETALNGRWVKAPVDNFLHTLLRHFPDLPIIAEDLGFITPDVTQVMKRFDFPGMKLLLFAFGQDLPTNPYAPHNFPKNCVVYTGTHDNNTVRGWFAGEASAEEKDRLFRYLGRVVSEDEVHWELIRLAMGSCADTVIVPMQDILGLGEEARMNLPASSSGHWEWRLTEDKLSAQVTEKFREMTWIFGRM